VLLPLFLAPLQNQFVGGGLVLLLTGSVIALLRNLPISIWNKIKDQFLISVSVVDNDPLFDWITLWLADHPYSKKTRRIRAVTKDIDRRESKEEDSKRRKKNALPEIVYSPAKGEHFFFYQGKFIWLTREKEGDDSSKDTESTAPSNFRRMMIPEQYTFRTIGRSQSVVRSLINDVLVHTAKERQEKTCVYVSSHNWWEKLFSYETRSLDSVILDGHKKEELLADMIKFMGEREWYVKRGVPYSRKYLFHGPPGNGKTSTIGALAGKLGLNLYVLNLSAGNVDDSDLFHLVRNVRPGSLLLLEDIDAVIPSRTNIEKEFNQTVPCATSMPQASTAPSNKAEDGKEQPKGVTLSGMLNIIDGVLTPDGLMLVMTTNRPQVLDSALTRPGRIDMSVEFNFATRQQILGSFAWFYPDRLDRAEEFADRFKGMKVSMATIQQKLMELKEERLQATEAAAAGD
jgi:chaperone BCS1